MARPVAISMSDVSYRYTDGTAALAAINMEIETGEAVAVVGPNGAGKTTLLQVMAGLIPATGGTVRVLGQLIDRKSVESPHELDWLRRRLGMIFQDPDVALFNSTVWNDVIFGPLHMGLPQDEVVRRGNQALERLGVGHLRDKAPYRLSGGEKRKVSIASVLSMDPEIVLFDEPTSDLDPRSRRTIIEILRGMTAQGKTVVVATHDVNAVPDFADRIVVLRRSVLASGDVRSILSDEQLLARADLSVPEVTRLFKVLASFGYRIDELPFSLDEAVEQIMRNGHMAAARTKGAPGDAPDAGQGHDGPSS
jgi:cobalt/nickel transport system ATP-binding protein